MSVGQAYTHPDFDILKAMLSGRWLIVVSPFYSPASLYPIDSENTKNTSFITCLPTRYIMPSVFIKNDPLALWHLLQKMESCPKLFAFPDPHANMHQNKNATWIGGSNFTVNGFSGKPEILIRFNGKNRKRFNVFDTYLKNSIRVRQDDPNNLSRWISICLTKVRTQPHIAGTSSEEVRKSLLTFKDFLERLSDAGQSHPAIRKHIHDRVRGKDYMSGHVGQTYNGTMLFPRMNIGHLPDLVGRGVNSISNHILEQFASFVRKFRDPRGGYWRDYLSTKLGGTQINGGAWDTVAKKCPVPVPSYIVAQRQSQFG